MRYIGRMRSIDVTATTASNSTPLTRTPMFGAAVRLAAFLSLVAVVVVLALDSLVEVSATAMAVSVASVGLATSWAITGRFSERQSSPATAHRVAVVPLPHRV